MHFVHLVDADKPDFKDFFLPKNVLGSILRVDEMFSIELIRQYLFDSKINNYSLNLNNTNMAPLFNSHTKHLCIF